MALTSKPLEILKSPYYNSAKGDIEDIPVLDSRHCQDVFFPSYLPPPKVKPEMDPLIWQHWVENLTCLKGSVSWLLKLQYQKFWCQAINNTSLHSFLDSYLKFAPRFLESSWPDDVSVVHNELHRLVFLTYIRLAANKESVSSYMMPEYFGKLIYEKYIFDIPKLMDICALYGNETNSELLSKAIRNVFKCQPRFNDDLKRSARTILQTFQSITDKCSSSDDHHASSSTSKLSDDKLKNMTLTELEDMIMYTSDICFTLQRFLVDVYPPACHYFLESVECFVDFYSTTLDDLRNTMRERHFDDLSLRSNMLAHLKISRFAILSFVRRVMNECLLELTLQASETGEKNQAEQHANEYLNLLSEFMDRSSFYHDFLRKTPVAEDVKSLIQHGPFIDETRVTFILQSLGVEKKSSYRHEVKEHANTNEDTSKRHEPNTGYEKPVHSANIIQKENRAIDSELASLVSTVRDVLPHFEEDYILSCLLHFERDSEKTIHALLEGTVPEFTKSYNTVEDSVEIESLNRGMALLNSRKSVFDNDEFDIYAHDNVDMSRIHKGKKKKDNLDDTSIADFKHIYERYSMVSDEEEITSDIGSELIGTYEDEYDDAYDGLGIDANDADDNYDVLKRRPFVTPRVFQQGKKAVRKESSDTSEDESRDAASTRDHFIPNPAEIRAKNEARRLQQQEQKRPRKANTESTRQSYKSGSAASAHQRKQKDVNKAKVANHNRKRMAVKKASKGMGPV